jgi:predicted transposase/invertase (TIGR01784 family)
MKKPILSAKSDYIFKLIFGDKRNTDVLASLLSSVLKIPQSEYEELTIIDPHVKKEAEKDKYGILDVKLTTKSGYVIHIEIQVVEIPDMIPRSIFYQSKMITEQIGSGQDWHLIQRVVSIIITDFPIKFIPQNDKYHNQFRYRTEDGTELTDLIETNTLELQKLPSVTDNSALWDWLEFIRTDSEEVLDMLQERSPEMRKAVGFLKELSADERTRMLAESRENARRDEASRMRGAERKKAKEIAREMMGDNMPVSQIIKYTGLSQDEIFQLSQ